MSAYPSEILCPKCGKIIKKQIMLSNFKVPIIFQFNCPYCEKCIEISYTFVYTGNGPQVEVLSVKEVIFKSLDHVLATTPVFFEDF